MKRKENWKTLVYTIQFVKLAGCSRKANINLKKHPHMWKNMKKKRNKNNNNNNRSKMNIL